MIKVTLCISAESATIHPAPSGQSVNVVLVTDLDDLLHHLSDDLIADYLARHRNLLQELDKPLNKGDEKDYKTV